MKTNRIVSKTFAAAALTLIGGYAAAADTQTIAVSASVAAVCKFSGAAAAIDFGAIDPSSAAGDKTVPVTVPYKCTKNLTPAVTTGAIVPLTSGANTMAFTLDAFGTVAGAGFSTAVNATSTARITTAVWQDAPAGNYVGSVVVDINN
jgi:hypothetical protein